MDKKLQKNFSESNLLQNKKFGFETDKIITTETKESKNYNQEFSKTFSSFKSNYGTFRSFFHFFFWNLIFLI